MGQAEDSPCPGTGDGSDGRRTARRFLKHSRRRWRSRHDQRSDHGTTLPWKQNSTGSVQPVRSIHLELVATAQYVWKSDLQLRNAGSFGIAVLSTRCTASITTSVTNGGPSSGYFVTNEQKIIHTAGWIQRMTLLCRRFTLLLLDGPSAETW